MLRHPCILGGPQTKGDKIRIGCLTRAFSGAQNRRTPAFSGVPKQRGTKSELAAFTPAFLGAQKRAEMLRTLP